VAHELLIALAGEDDNMFANSLSWPITMEMAIQRSLSMLSRLTTLGRFIFAAMYFRATNMWTTARIPVANVDFPLIDMGDYCHTEASYGILNKDETQKLVEKCRREGVTVTSAVCSAILCVASTLVNSKEDQLTALNFAIGADTRRRCVPPVPNHDLSYHVSGIMSFITPTRDIPTTSEGMWQLAKAVGQHIKTSIDAGQILALGMIMGKIFEKTLGPPNFAELPTCGISSWDVLPFREQYGRWELVAMAPFVNMIRGVMPFTVIQTVNGILTILYVGNDPIIPLSLVESLRDGTMQKLHQMIDN
jgi:hypothetical protein